MRNLSSKYLLLIIGLAACHASHPRDSPSSPTENIVFGDSVAFGLGTSSPSHNLTNYLARGSGLCFANAGVPGITTREALEQIDEILRLRPKRVVLSIGATIFCPT